MTYMGRGLSYFFSIIKNIKKSAGGTNKVFTLQNMERNSTFVIQTFSHFFENDTVELLSFKF